MMRLLSIQRQNPCPDIFARSMIWIVLIWISLNGCGPAHPVKEDPVSKPHMQTPLPSQDHALSLARSLGLQIKAQSSSPSEESLDFDPKYFKNNISFGKSFTKPAQARKLYFSWPITFNNQTIQFVNVSYQYLNENNSLSSEIQIGNPRRYPESNQWTISLSEVLSARFKSNGKDGHNPIHGPTSDSIHETVNESETQILHLDLLLTDHSQIKIQIKFRTSGNIL